MIHYRHPIKGIDEPIFELQKMLHDTLACEWKLGDQEYQCFGRCYRNPVQGGFIPEVYRGDGEYKEVLLDDKYTALSFFGRGDTVTIDGPDNIEQIHCVFFIHLGAIATLDLTDTAKTLPNEVQHQIRKANPGRADLEARNAVQAILNQNYHGFTLQSIVTGPNALQEYVIRRNGQQNNTDFAKFDMQPFHVFRVNGTLRYQKPTFNHFN